MGGYTVLVPFLVMPPSRSHPEALALYRAILAHPDEDTPRLLYADWLDEHGEPTQAEFIRLQCRLARMNEWDDGYVADELRAKRLQKEHEPYWLELPEGAARHEYGENHCGMDFVRGFLGMARVAPKLTDEELHHRFAGFPITHADFFFDQSGGDPCLYRLTSAALPRLRSARLYLGAPPYPVPHLGVDACRVLAQAECRSELKRLEISGDPTLAGLEAIITSPHLRNLESLEVSRISVGDAHAALLAEKMALPALRELIFGEALTPAGAEVLGRAEWFARLHTVRLDKNSALGDEGLAKLLAAPRLALRTLRVHWLGPTEALVRLAGGPNLSDLTEVTRAEGRDPSISADGLAALVAGPQRFLALTIDRSRTDEPAVANLFAGPAVRDLRRLVVPGARLNAPAVSALLRSPLPHSLRDLRIGCGPATDLGAALVAGPDWPHLERLLVPTGMPAASILNLIESDKFPRLVSLLTKVTGETEGVWKAIARCPATARLREIVLDAPLTPDAAHELADSPHLASLDRLIAQKGQTTEADRERLNRRVGGRFSETGEVAVY